MATGLYRVYKTIREKDRVVWSYRIHNKMLKKEFYRKDIMTLKASVIDAGLLWGIIDIEEAKKTSKETGVKLKDLQGRYGIQVED